MNVISISKAGPMRNTHVYTRGTGLWGDYAINYLNYQNGFLTSIKWSTAHNLSHSKYSNRNAYMAIYFAHNDQGEGYFYAREFELIFLLPWQPICRRGPGQGNDGLEHEREPRVHNMTHRHTYITTTVDERSEVNNKGQRWSLCTYLTSTLIDHISRTRVSPCQ